MKLLFQKNLTASQMMLIIINIIPLVGVWFYGWDAKSIFLVYCLESVIIGLFNFFQLWLITLVKKKDVWDETTSTKQSGYFFMFFFLAHYGIFIFVQLSIFLGIMQFDGKSISVADLLLHFYRYIPPYAQYLLLSFVVGYAFIVMKEFILSGKYKEISMAEQMFSPYGRILVQQLVVILGSFFLLLNEQGKIFMLVFVAIKILFDVFLSIKMPLNKTKN